jgi:NAD(P)-dependent dehydrogenase (short-subunit alcohol dehydrogenase family)
METIVISGANRGIGRELTRRFLQAGKRVIAGCRHPDQAEALRNLADAGGKLEIAQLDVADAASVAALGKMLKGQAVDVLMNNAGVMGGEHQSLKDMDYSAWLRTFEINTLAPFRLAATLLPNLKLSKCARIVTVSSQMGAFAMEGMGVGHYAYCSAKTAVSRTMQIMAAELKADGIIVCPVHPGWVRTDMGGPNAEISVEESGGGLFRLIENLTLAQSGRFWRWDGSEHPW